MLHPSLHLSHFATPTCPLQPPSHPLTHALPQAPRSCRRPIVSTPDVSRKDESRPLARLALSPWSQAIASPRRSCQTCVCIKERRWLCVSMCLLENVDLYPVAWGPIFDMLGPCALGPITLVPIDCVSLKKLQNLRLYQGTKVAMCIYVSFGKC